VAGATQTWQASVPPWCWSCARLRRQVWEWRKADATPAPRSVQRQLFEENFYDRDVLFAASWMTATSVHLSLLEPHLPRAAKGSARVRVVFFLEPLPRRSTDEPITRPYPAGELRGVFARWQAPGHWLGRKPSADLGLRHGKRVMRLPSKTWSRLAFAPDGQTLGVGRPRQSVVWNLEREADCFPARRALANFASPFPRRELS